MAAARKTVPVEAVRDRVNHFLTHSQNHETAARKALASLLESILLETGNYKGFLYLASELQTGPDGIEAGLRDGYDDTRRQYLS